jgi:hypothetical protein
MDAKHTEAPWMAAAGPSSIVGWPVVAASGRLICTMATPPQNITRASAGKERERYDAFMAEVRANAHVVAAAPDLLAALQKLEAAITDGFDTQAQRMAGRQALIAARAALAKAQPA